MDIQIKWQNDRVFIKNGFCNAQEYDKCESIEELAEILKEYLKENS